MKVRDSGMPEEAYWASFFNVESALDALIPQGNRQGDWLEIGCGYGTFSLPVAKCISGQLSAFDIEPDMVSFVTEAAAIETIHNLAVTHRDVVGQGTGFEHNTQSGVMIYNLLHLDEPVELLKEAKRNLKSNGCLSVIHWRSDIPTPRGPNLDIRPTPEQSIAWIKQAGFSKVDVVDLEESCPYHYGLIAWV